MGVKDLGLFGVVILGGLALGWMTPGEATTDPATSPDGGQTTDQAPASGMAGTGGFWPNSNPVPEGERDLPNAAPTAAEQMRSDARASFRAEMAKSGVTNIRVAPEGGSSPAPTAQATAAAPTQAQDPAFRPDSSPASGWSRPTSGAGGWGVQAGVPPTTGPMAPPPSTARPSQASN